MPHKALAIAAAVIATIYLGICGLLIGLVRNGGEPVAFTRLLGPYARIQQGWYAHLHAMASGASASRPRASDTR